MKTVSEMFVPLKKHQGHEEVPPAGSNDDRKFSTCVRLQFWKKERKKNNTLKQAHVCILSLIHWSHDH
jgi:hypothetical protein